MVKENYCSIVLMTKDENRYLDEFVKYHLNLGFDRIYIYDNLSKIPVRETLKDSPFADRITIIEYHNTGIGTQPACYIEACKGFGSVNEWLLFIDTDEFVYLHKHNNIKDFLIEYDNEVALGACWVMFGSNGKDELQDSIIEAFTKHSEYTYEPNRHIKSFVKPEYVRFCVTPHYFIMNNGQTVDEHKKPITNSLVESNCFTNEFIQINHYYTRSRADWALKIERGRGDYAGSRNWEEFHSEYDKLNAVEFDNTKMLNILNKF